MNEYEAIVHIRYPKLFAPVILGLAVICALIAGSLFYFRIPWDPAYSLGRYAGSLAAGAVVLGISYWRYRARAKDWGITGLSVLALVVTFATFS